MDSCPAARRRSPVNEDDLLEDRFFIFQLILLDLGLVIMFCRLLRFTRVTSMCMSDFDTVHAWRDKRTPPVNTCFIAIFLKILYKTLVIKLMRTINR